MTTPRPDQQHAAHASSAAGSRSGSGDVAAALGYPGVPPAVPNCQSARQLRSGAGVTAFFTFPGTGRIWTVNLSYELITDSAYSAGTFFTDAIVSTVLSGVTLAVINLGLAAANQHAEGNIALPLPGLPMVQGESLQLAVNNGVAITDVFQRASVVVLYSIP